MTLGKELDHDELELLQSISAMLRQEETEPDDGSPAAARLLRYWAAFYEDTWVWGGESGYLPYSCSMADLHGYIRTPVILKQMKMQSHREWPSSSASWRVRTSLARGRTRWEGRVARELDAARWRIPSYRLREGGYPMFTMQGSGELALAKRGYSNSRRTGGVNKLHVCCNSWYISL